jgi:hypothetical protein
MAGVLALGTAALFGQAATTTAPTPNQPMEKLLILEPTQGRPRMVRAGEPFYFMFRVEKMDVPKIEVMLASSLCEDQRIKLTADGPPMAIQGNNWVTMLKAPTGTPPGTYDLLIDLGVGYQRVANAIKVIDQFKSTFRFVHLSNMNIGDPTSPEFDDRLVDEINLLAPEFILATGDFVEKGWLGDGNNQWRKVREFLGKFQAPCYVLCGDQDDPVSFTRQINPSLVGTLNYGRYHFFLMLDTCYHPIECDTSQIKALVGDLENNQNAAMTFLVGNRDNLGLLDGLLSIKLDPAAVLAKGKVRYLIFGGSTDWDFQEYLQKLSSAKLSDVKYIRTGQSSTCMKNGGSGVSRYRVFDVDGEKVDYLYPDEQAKASIQSSVPAGHLKTIHQGPNDGTKPMERAIVVNGLNQSFANARVVFRIAGTDPKAVRVLNGRLERSAALPNGQLLVSARIDLPEKSSTQVMATSDPLLAKVYDRLPVKITLDGSKKLTFTPAITPAGLNFFAAGETLELTLTNESNAAIRLTPQVTLAGQEVTVSEMAAQTTSQAKETTAAPCGDNEIELPAKQTVKLTIRPAVRNVSPGKHAVVVYLLNDPLQRASAFPVEITVAGK